MAEQERERLPASTLLEAGSVEATGAPKEIGAGIIRLLSEGSYTTFAQALKELVSNAFDAGAKRVDIRTLNDCRDVVVQDDGSGMTHEEFRDNWARIVGGTKRQPSAEKKAAGRALIGFMGVGTLAVARACKEVRVVSRKQGSEGLFDARLDFESMMQEDKYSQPLSDVYRYDLLKRELPAAATSEGFTYVILRGISEDIRSELLRQGVTLADSFSSAAANLSGMELLRWNLGLLCPVGYAGDGPVAGSADAQVVWLRKARLEDEFRVFVDGNEVLRPVVLPSYGSKPSGDQGELYHVWSAQKTTKSGVRFRAYIVAQRYQVTPQELRGLHLRLRGVGIGAYRSDFFGVTVPSAVVARSVSGEIYVEAGLDDAVTLERTDVRRDHRGFIELREWIESQVALVSQWHYSLPRKRRKATKQKSETYRQRMVSVLEAFSAGPLSRRSAATKVVESTVLSPSEPVSISHDRQKITINRNHPVFAHSAPGSPERELLEMFVFALQLGYERSGGDAARVGPQTLEVLERLLAAGPQAS